jgi:hypothetical protein
MEILALVVRRAQVREDRRARDEAERTLKHVSSANRVMDSELRESRHREHKLAGKSEPSNHSIPH